MAAGRIVIWKLEAAFKCRSCPKGRYAPPVPMIKLTGRRQITPYRGCIPMMIGGSEGGSNYCICHCLSSQLSTRRCVIRYSLKRGRYLDRVQPFRQPLTVSYPEMDVL
jgi:hypothetical protein